MIELAGTGKLFAVTYSEAIPGSIAFVWSLQHATWETAPIYFCTRCAARVCKHVREVEAHEAPAAQTAKNT